MNQPAPAFAEPMRRILPDQLEQRDLYFLLNSVIVPRPIAWVSTLAADGTANLAPHSFCTVFSDVPPILGFVSVGEKDTVRNVRSGGDFVIHIVDREHVEQMNLTAAAAPADVSEFEVAGLAMTRSEFVRSLRVASAPVAIECEAIDVQEIGRGRLILGRCVAFHIADRVFDERDRVAPGELDAVARMGASTYSTTRDRFDLRRPQWEDIASSRA